MDLLHLLVEIVVWVGAIVALVYFIGTGIAYVSFGGIALRELLGYRRRLDAFPVEELVRAASVPPVTLIAPMYNEEAVCVEATRSLLGIEYPNFEVMLVNDGSKDATMATLIEAFALEPVPRTPTAEVPAAATRALYRSRLHPALWVLDKDNGGKADAINAGINFCRTPLFCALDADGLLERDALARAVRPFLEDETTVAVGGTIRIVNDCLVRGGRVEQARLPGSWLGRFQVVEYLRAFVVARTALDRLGGLLIISGAFGVFRRTAVVDVGGFARDCIGEDMELIVRLHRYHRERKIPYRIAYAPDAVVWTEAPESRAVLGRQRDRWHRGLAQVLTLHRGMLLNPRYGSAGMIGMPFFAAVEFGGPLVEALGYAALVLALAFGIVDVPIALALLAIALTLGVLHSAAAIALEELSFRKYTRLRDLLGLLALGVLENLGYRQMTLYWRLRGFVSFLRGNHQWGDMQRKGFATTPSLPAAALPAD